MKRENEIKAGQGLKDKGFTMVELIATVAVLAIMTGIGVGIAKGFRSASENVGLRSHLKMVNTAVDIYVANCGDLDGVATGGGVLAKLKTVAESGSARKINGLRGSMLDRRVMGITQTAAEAASGQARAIWNSTKVRFEMANSGAAGFKKFVFDDVEAPLVEEARVTSLALASSSNWVWDYADSDARPGGMSAPTVGSVPTTTTPPTAVPPGMLTLDPPAFSIPGGSYEYAAFGLDLYFLDPNPTGVSQIFYSVNGATWTPYAGSAVVVQPDDLVTAYSVSIDPDGWLDSTPVLESYEMTFVITGATSGLFSNPVGGPDMVTGGWGNYFTWGTPATWEGFTDPSSLLYEGASFVNVSEGEQFMLGSLEYYNGTIASGSGADALSLSVNLVFGEGTQSEEFDYDLNLINSPNLPDGTLAESADYVQFGNIYAEVPATLGGVEYMLIIEFGDTSDGGFSSVDEFFVYEGETATGNLYGTLVRAWGDGGDEG